MSYLALFPRFSALAFIRLECKLISEDQGKTTVDKMDKITPVFLHNSTRLRDKLEFMNSLRSHLLFYFRFYPSKRTHSIRADDSFSKQYLKYLRF